MTGSRTALERVQVAVRVEGPITLLIVPVAYSLFDDAGRDQSAGTTSASMHHAPFGVGSMLVMSVQAA